MSKNKKQKKGNQDEEREKLLTSKVYKIKYSLNLLPQLGTYLNKDIDIYTQNKDFTLMNDNINFLEFCYDSHELSMFEADTLQELIEFKWK